MLGRKDNGIIPDESKIQVKKPIKKTSPTTSINWAQYGKVTPVKNQGRCFISDDFLMNYRPMW